MALTDAWKADNNVKLCTWRRSISLMDEKCNTCARSNQMTPASASPGRMCSSCLTAGSWLSALARSRCHAAPATITRSPSAKMANTTQMNWCQ